MAKVKSAFFCQNCGTQYPKWVGQCTVCKSWNTVTEEIIHIADKTSWNKQEPQQTRTAKPVRVSEIPLQNESRIRLGDEEFNRVLGGGLVSGSVALLGGEPGIGKSTLLLQVAMETPIKVLYVSGEESQRQIKMRADRLKGTNPSCFILSETHTDRIFQQASQLEPELLIIDSVQTLQSQYIDSVAGSISQVKQCAAECIRFAKETDTPVILVGHITKEGSLAGPKVLEHMVDTVLQFEGDQHYVFRILRGLKNRFGSTSELGIYEMQQDGLRQVSNPSEILISGTDEALSGTAVAATLEGMRPLMIEIQALVSSAVYGTPQRSATGFNLKRLNMLLAVLEKRAGFKLGAKDVFLNLTGGIQLDDPALDLAVAVAILSSGTDIAIPKDICFAAEIGLAGEVRAVQRVDQRIQEAEKLGFSRIFISQNSKFTKRKTGIDVATIAKIEDIAKALFG